MQKGFKQTFVTASFAETEWLDSLNIPMEWRQIKISVGDTYFFC